MARDRKRAKQRQRQRARRQPAGVPARRPAQPAPPEPVPDLAPDSLPDAPDPLEHASGDAEIAEAAERAIAELDGPTTPLREDEYPQADELEGADELEEDEDELEEEEDDDRAVAVAATGRRPAARARPSGRELPREGNRFVNFLRACWAELQRVQWPDRRQVAQATGVVLFFVLIAGGYLGLLDAIFSRLVKAIL
jgi:preprotein translocase subunit SecE